MLKTALPLLIFALIACGDGDSPTSSDRLSKSDLNYDWTSAETGATWSFDSDGRFWFFTGLLSDDDGFTGTWSLDGDRITLAVADRSALVLQVELKSKVLTITQQCDESADFFTEAQLTNCRANPTTNYNRASLFD